MTNRERPINCIIVHGCPDESEKARHPKTRTYDKHWMPWLEKELTARGIKVARPLMPTPWSPDYQKFKEELEKQDIIESTVLVGHSCGASFLVRWLGETKKKVAKLILVAPWSWEAVEDKSNQNLKFFYAYDIDKAIPERVKEIVMFTSDTEWEEGKESVKKYHAALGGRVIELKNHGHYIKKHMGKEEFPELLAELLEG